MGRCHGHQTSAARHQVAPQHAPEATGLLQTQLISNELSLNGRTMISPAAQMKPGVRPSAWRASQMFDYQEAKSYRPAIRGDDFVSPQVMIGLKFHEVGQDRYLTTEVYNEDR